MKPLEKIEQGVWGKERFRLTLGIVLVITVFSVDTLGIAPALPAAVAELQGRALFGWVFSSFMLAWLVGTVSGGLLSDARGPRLPMIIGLALFMLGLLISGIAQIMPQLLLGRTLQGAGGGAIIAATYVIMARAYPDALRARIMALLASAWILPALAAPALAGMLAEWLGWRLVFISLIPLSLIAALIILPPLRQLDVKRSGIDLTPIKFALCVAIGAGLVLAAGSLLDTIPLALLCLISGSLLFLPALRALLPVGTFCARPGLPSDLAGRGLLSFSFYGTEAFIPLAVTELYGANLIQAGLALSAGALGWIAASWLLERIEARANSNQRHTAVIAGFVLLALGIAIVAVALLCSLPLTLLLLGWAIAGGGVGLAYTAGNLLCFARVKSGQEGEVSGQLQIVEALASAVATGLGGALLAQLKLEGLPLDYAHTAVCAVTLGIAVIGIVVAVRARHGEKDHNLNYINAEPYA